jgi:flagellar protein FliL
MRKILLLVVALLLLGGGGAGAYFYFFQPAQASPGDAATAETEKGHEAKKGKGGHGSEALSAFVELDPLILPVVDGEGVNQVISLVIALEVADEETAKAVEAMSPKLKDAFIQDMYGALNVHEALKGGVVQVGMIKARLTRISTEVLGEDVIHSVLLQVVQQRPI